MLYRLVRSRNPRAHGGKPSSQLGRLAENARQLRSREGRWRAAGFKQRRAVRNEDEAHPMSPEKATTVEPNRLNRGESCQDWTLANLATSGRGRNDRWSNHRHGRVGGHGMRVQVVDIRDEISGDAPLGATAGPSGQTVRPVWSAEKSERSIVATKAVMTPERRGRTWSKIYPRSRRAEGKQ
jgi:hypothetical protein